MSLADSYFDTATGLLASAREKNAATLKTLGPVIGRSIAAGGVLHTFGSGHSELIGREIIGRAGGLMPVTGMIDPGYGFSENVVGYGTRLAERYHHNYGLKAGESIIVISNSGKNASPIEVALAAKKHGLTVIALTSLAMSTTSRTVHPGGKNLHAIADYTLDNLGVTGDAITEVNPGVFAGPTSTLIGTTLLNLLVLEVVGWLKTNGHPLHLVTSQNVPGGMEANIALSQNYRTRLSKLIG
ncbi:MAG TPA: sugar isomerase domain-containing protein [Rariglobus sp.]|nr:sugar isomerase domain-containing protein [Rariglobus sp.]